MRPRILGLALLALLALLAQACAFLAPGPVLQPSVSLLLFPPAAGASRPRIASVDTRSRARSVLETVCKISTRFGGTGTRSQSDWLAYDLLTVGGLAPNEIESLLSIANSRTAKAGDILNEHDAITSSAYEDKVLLMLSGTAEITHAGIRERTLGPGDFAGESEFLQLEVTEKLNELSVDPVEEFFNAAGF